MERPTVAAETAVPHHKNMLPSTQQKLRILWDNNMSNPVRTVHHEKTSVLLISWDPADDDLHVEKEVTGLKHTFDKKYGFSVSETVLTKKKAKIQALANLSNFVLENDEEQSLLIIYYAGHGFGGTRVYPGDIMLAGTTQSPNAPDPYKEYKEAVRWSQIETAVSMAEHADVLLIFDCCNAGRLCQPFARSADPRNHYQVLGACTEDQITRGPGDESFTTALIWALDHLAAEEVPFSTSRLRNEIRKYPLFPTEQVPVLSNRESRDTLGDIVICRKGLPPASPKLTATELGREVRREKAYVDLRFVFDDEVSDDRFKETAQVLRKWRDGDTGRGLQLSRIAFLSKYTATEHAALRFREALQAGGKKTPSVVAPLGSDSLIANELLKQVQIDSPRPNPTPEKETEKMEIAPFNTLLEVPGAEGASKATSITTIKGDDTPSPSPNQDSIMYHVRQIGRQLQQSVAGIFGRKKKIGLASTPLLLKSGDR